MGLKERSRLLGKQKRAVRIGLEGLRKPLGESEPVEDYRRRQDLENKLGGTMGLRYAGITIQKGVVDALGFSVAAGHAIKRAVRRGRR